VIKFVVCNVSVCCTSSSLAAHGACVLASGFDMFMSQDPEFVANLYPAICLSLESNGIKNFPKKIGDCEERCDGGPLQ